MAVEPIAFTDEELELIRVLTERGEGWDCAEYNPLRSRIKQFYLKGQAFRCCYCQKPNPVQHGRAWDIEHVISRALNATFMFEPENLAVSCIDCNLAKRDADILAKPRRTFPRNSDAYTIVHPHFDDWGDHFVLGQIVYAPKTAKGAETLRVCKLWRFYEMIGQESLLATDQRYVELAERVLFAKTPVEAEPSVLAMRALIQDAKDGA
uniref:HNH endonuclease n=1 Tax=Caulobacter sp. (strain K31) TaxID=366602 RepID=B0T8P9_CAUSK